MTGCNIKCLKLILTGSWENHKVDLIKR